MRIEILKEDAGSKKTSSLNMIGVLKRFRKAMSNKGITKFGSPLGQGTRGAVFPINDGRVLKVTSDDKEAAASAKIKGQDVPGVVHVFDVFKYGDNDLYGIVQERLAPLPPETVKKLNDALGLTQFPLLLRKTGYDWDRALELVGDHTRENFEKMIEKYPAQEEKLRARAQQLLENLELVLDEYNLREYFENLKNVGVDFHDFSGDNLMIRPSDKSIVITDLGYSKVKGGGKPDILPPDVVESVLRDILDRLF